MMATFSDYPKTMKHPAHAPAVVGERYVDNRGKVSYGQGEPERFPDVYVNDADQEEEERAKGYIAFGETQDIFTPDGWAEYPMCLTHPEHVEAIPDERHEQRETDGSISRWTTPGSPEKFPHVFVKDENEEAEWTAKGWRRNGVLDPDAFSTALASPYVPGYVESEYPKYVDGKIIQDPRLMINGLPMYPKYIASHETIVGSPEEEAKLLGRVMEVPKAPVEAAQDELAALRAEVAALKAAAVQPSPTPEE